MEIAAVNALLCPHCGLSFNTPAPGDNALVCASGHTFDIARQGYLNLLTGHGTKFVPDTADMVGARDAFLDAGHYQGLGDALAARVQAHLASTSEPALVVDAGTGTGWYLQQVLAATSARGPAAIGLDISKFALRRAARRNPLAANIVWDLWRELPLGAGTADVVLVIFAPRNAAEFARILKPGGMLMVVTPLPSHLADIAQEAGMLGIQEDKEAALVQSMAGDFQLVDSQELLVPLELSPADVGNVALMGPAGHHVDALELGRKLAHMPDMTHATAAFRISVFAPRTRA
ncbi:23S rRNA m(1)G-748 methyltransferase [Arthrobacter alpinus]|uniref:23S rRNA m(1)G-748 methyltransferase n=1 Tax=Arthrobacter alpinus TaxID=656366 RepID=A0A1H5IZC1_9MICC|nr:methyltransferase domain-containing protein [Arthrobacter alpinus]SEE44738.1 23S rRNA m(1)G-748 methyltransferase [Arthrobacter alpinus]